MNLIWNGNHTAGLVEQAQSGNVARGDNAEWTQVFRGPYAQCVIAAPWKGAIGGSTNTLGWRVREVRIEKERGGIGTLSIVWEPNGASPPPDASLPPTEISITPTKYRVPLIRHPRYHELKLDAAFSLYYDEYTHPNKDTDVAVLRGLMVSFSSLGAEVVAKLAQGLEEIDVTGLVCEITTHSWAFPTMVLGGTVSDTGPALPYDGVWPEGFSWRRNGDKVSWNGSYFTTVSSYEGAPTHMWDGTIAA